MLLSFYWNCCSYALLHHGLFWCLVCYMKWNFLEEIECYFKCGWEIKWNKRKGIKLHETVCLICFVQIFCSWYWINVLHLSAQRSENALFIVRLVLLKYITKTGTRLLTNYSPWAYIRKFHMARNYWKQIVNFLEFIFSVAMRPRQSLSRNLILVKCRTWDLELPNWKMLSVSGSEYLCDIFFYRMIEYSMM